MNYLVYYGSKRTKNAAQLASYDVVITTYHIVLSEWRKNWNLHSGNNGVIHKILWRRVILDEGVLQNRLNMQNC